MRDRHMAVLCDDYLERARRHVVVDVVEVEDDAGLRRRLPTGGAIVALEVDGLRWTTEDLAKYVGDQMLHGARSVAFLIGGADGLPRDVVARATQRLSLSTLTLPHHLARVVLCEQIYRAL